MITKPKKTAADHANELVILEKEIDRLMAAGEIDKPSYESLKYKVDRAIEGTAEVIRQEHVYGSGDKFYRLGDDHLLNLSHAIPHAAREVLFLANKLAKVKTTDHALYLDCAAYFERYKGIATKLIDLKSKIVSSKARRASKADAAEQVRVAKFREYATLVAVLQQHMTAYIDRAGEVAATVFDGWMKELAAHGWDVDKAAPKPGNDVSYRVYQNMAERRSTFISWTEPVDGTKSMIRKLSATERAEYIARSRSSAHSSYMAWIYKMIQKIGRPVTEADMSGNPWIGSTLKLVTNDGATQAWRTQMIINYSKYGRPYNQFPSRRTDGGKAA